MKSFGREDVRSSSDKLVVPSSVTAAGNIQSWSLMDADDVIAVAALSTPEGGGESHGGRDSASKRVSSCNRTAQRGGVKRPGSTSGASCTGGWSTRDLFSAANRQGEEADGITVEHSTAQHSASARRLRTGQRGVFRLRATSCHVRARVRTSAKHEGLQ